MKTSYWSWLTRLWVPIFFLAVGLWIPQVWAAPVAACVPNASGWGNPSLDGVVENMYIPTTSSSYIADQGWNQSYRFNLYRQDHPTGYSLGDVAGAHVKLIKSNYNPTTKQGTLWLAVWVDAAPEIYNTVVLGIAGTSADIWRLHLSPFCNGSCGSPRPAGMYVDLGAPAESQVSNHYPAMNVWHGASVSAINTASGPMSAPSWANSSTVNLARDTNRWSVEIKVPYTTNQAMATDQLVYLPVSGEFKMYFNVLSTYDSGVGPFVNQRPWPQSMPLGSANNFGLIESNTPDYVNWGVVSLDGTFTTPSDPVNPAGPKVSCAGVEIHVGDFGVRNNSLPSNNVHKMAALAGPFFDSMGNPITTAAGCSSLPDTPTGSLNTFYAKPINMSVIKAASNISGDFYVADWGISNNWSRIGTLAPPSGSSNGSNATPTTAISLAPSVQNEVTATWALTQKQSCMYLVTNSAHHCVQVVLNSTDPNTSFSQVSATDNFDFVGMSTFDRTVALSSPDHNNTRQMILESRRQAIDYSPTPDQVQAKAVSSSQREGRKFFFAPVNKDYIPPSLSIVPSERFSGPITSAYLWTVEGHLLNGHKIRINGKDFEDTDYAGAFGYLGGHNGPVSGGFEAALSGAGVKKINENHQLVEVPPEGLVINSRMEAKETVLPPHCPCASMGCPKLAANESGAISKSLVLVGTLGVGGFAFLRRRRNQKSSVERSED